MGAALQGHPDVAGQRPDVSTFAAHHPDDDFRQFASQQFHFVDDQRLGFQFHLFPFTGQIVRTASVHFASREDGRHLFYRTYETIQRFLHHFTGDMFRGILRVHRLL